MLRAQYQCSKELGESLLIEYSPLTYEVERIEYICCFPCVLSKAYLVLIFLRVVLFDRPLYHLSLSCVAFTIHSLLSAALNCLKVRGDAVVAT